MSKPELALYAKEGTGRAYRHPFLVGSDGKPVDAPSVTTILKKVAKGDGVVQWAVDQTLEWAIENLSLLYVKDHDSSTRWGRWRWKDALNERAEVGTGVHETIEAEHKGNWEYPVLDAEQKQIMEQWRRLNLRYEVTAHESEFTVWGAFDEYAGTADGRWDITDRETGESWSNLVIDIKTSKNTYPEHWMQLAALARAPHVLRKDSEGVWGSYANAYGDGVAIIHLRADYYEVLVEDDDEVIDAYFREFLAYRNVWAAEDERTKTLKTREINSVKGF